jgi:hypothetical protein
VLDLRVYLRRRILRSEQSVFLINPLQSCHTHRLLILPFHFPLLLWGVQYPTCYDILRGGYCPSFSLPYRNLP